MADSDDVVIAGAGHNALIAGCYLAKADDSTRPGGVTGGPGRNATQVIFEDLGLDFDKVCG